MRRTLTKAIIKVVVEKSLTYSNILSEENFCLEKCTESLLKKSALYNELQTFALLQTFKRLKLPRDA